MNVWKVKKSNGQRVIFGDANELRAGETVAVTSEDGTVTHERIDHVGKPFAAQDSAGRWFVGVYGYTEPPAPKSLRGKAPGL